MNNDYKGRAFSPIIWIHFLKKTISSWTVSGIFYNLNQLLTTASVDTIDTGGYDNSGSVFIIVMHILVYTL